MSDASLLPVTTRDVTTASEVTQFTTHLSSMLQGFNRTASELQGQKDQLLAIRGQVADGLSQLDAQLGTDQAMARDANTGFLASRRVSFVNQGLGMLGIVTEQVLPVLLKFKANMRISVNEWALIRRACVLEKSLEGGAGSGLLAIKQEDLPGLPKCMKSCKKTSTDYYPPGPKTEKKALEAFRQLSSNNPALANRMRAYLALVASLQHPYLRTCKDLGTVLSSGGIVLGSLSSYLSYSAVAQGIFYTAAGSAGSSILLKAYQMCFPDQSEADSARLQQVFRSLETRYSDVEGGGEEDQEEDNLVYEYSQIIADPVYGFASMILDFIHEQNPTHLHYEEGRRITNYEGPMYLLFRMLGSSQSFLDTQVLATRAVTQGASKKALPEGSYAAIYQAVETHFNRHYGQIIPSSKI